MNMGKLYDRICGLMRLEICGALPEGFLNACALQGVRLRGLRRVDACTFHVSIREGDLAAAQQAAQNSGCECKILRHWGGSRNLRFLRRRIWLPVTAALMAAALFVSSLFIWELDVRGCETLSTGQVLRTLADCGVEQGSYWPGLQPDLVRSRMLQELPELDWMTVNVSGSRAVVLVSERREKPEIYGEGAACDLVATRTGIVTRLNVLNGKPRVSPGQAVTEGELLVSGELQSLSRPARYVRALGAVTADTWYELTVVCPAEAAVKSGRERRRSRFALKIGKKRVNFYWNGGKSLDGCGKIMHEYNLGVNGLFALPISLVREELIYREKSTAESADAAQMREHLLQYLEARIDGEILSTAFTEDRSGELCTVTLRAQCRENIAGIREIDRTGELPQGEAAP